MDPLWSNIFRKHSTENTLAHFLGNLPTFSTLTGNDLQRLEAIVHLRNYGPHETVFEEGDPGSGMYMIRSGSVSIFCRDARGNEEELARLEVGDFFGETTLTAPAPRSASARAIEQTELVGLFRSDLLLLVEQRPGLASRILFGLTRAVSERLQDAGAEIRRLKRLVAAAPPADSADS